MTLTAIYLILMLVAVQLLRGARVVSGPDE